MSKIKLLIVDDDQVWLKGISRFLDKEDDLLVIGTATTGEEAVKYVQSFNPDVVLMDLNLSGNKYDGIDTSQDILNIKNPKIIILTSLKDKEMIGEAFAAGAVNYFCKDDFETLPHAIRACYNAISPIEILGMEYQRLREESRLTLLTNAERELYELKKSGYTLAQIGDKLHKSTSTLKKQMNNLLKKLEAKRFKDVSKIKKY